MSEFPLQMFIDLVSFDQKTYALEDEIQVVQQEVENLEQSQGELVSEQDRLNQKMYDAKKRVDRAELDMKGLEQQEKNEKKRLDSVQNQKEYQSINKEIVTLKKKQHDYEETLILAWNKFETAKKEHELGNKKYEEKIKALYVLIEEKKQKIKTLQADLQDRIAQRDEKKKDVPGEWMEKYVLMRSRVANPVVPVIGGNCTACFYNLPPQDALELRRRKLLQCKGCYRFLYNDQSG